MGLSLGFAGYATTIGSIIGLYKNYKDDLVTG